MKYYVGLDVSLATTAICTVEENGARPMLVARTHATDPLGQLSIGS